MARQVTASQLDTRSWEERARFRELLLASDRVLFKHKSLFSPCVATILANRALFFSHLALWGTGRYHPVNKSVGLQLKSSILAVYALRYDCFDKDLMALV